MSEYKTQKSQVLMLSPRLRRDVTTSSLCRGMDPYPLTPEKDTDAANVLDCVQVLHNFSGKKQHNK